MSCDKKECEIGSFFTEGLTKEDWRKIREKKLWPPEITNDEVGEKWAKHYEERAKYENLEEKRAAKNIGKT